MEGDEAEDPRAASRLAKRNRAEWFARVNTLDFEHFLIEAYRFNDREGDTDGYRPWLSELFYFVWLIRGHPTMTDKLAKPKEALKVVERYVKGWSSGARARKEPPPYGLTPDTDAWYEWFGVADVDARVEFVDVWNRSRYLPGHDPVEQAADANRRLRLLVNKDVAERRPLDDPKARSETDYEFFVGLAAHLQVSVGDRPIKLPCAKLSDVLGVSKMTVSRYRRWAIEDGMMKVVRKHSFRSSGVSDATEFRFDVSGWDKVAAKAEGGTTATFGNLRSLPATEQ